MGFDESKVRRGQPGNRGQFARRSGVTSDEQRQRLAAQAAQTADDDRPTTTRPDGTKVWLKDGLLHRKDGPAIVDSDGGEAWYRNDRYHRDDGPAVTDPDGYEAWWHDGRLHRDDGPALTYPDGGQEWWRDGIRVDPPSASEPGPAVK